MTTMTEAESITTARMYRKLAKRRPEHYADEFVWKERVTLMADQVRNLFRNEIAGDDAAAAYVRQSLKNNAVWLEGILRQPRLVHSQTRPDQ